MLTIVGKSLFCAVLFLFAATASSAAVVYDLSLPENGNVDAIHVQLTVQGYLVGGLDLFFVGDPEVTLFSSGSTALPFAVIGVAVSPSVTLFGAALADASGNFAVLNPNFPDDFFVFNRVPNQNGTFFSVSGNVAADPPFMLDTTTPTAQLVVSGEPVPEPASILTFATGAMVFALVRSRKRS